ncbi:MAG: hypothetical protein EOP48_18820 [Sphingobacteriales bacterium]|nr:MAG: hypothetical protein EOP48_18820 [Sphingobacteriales bacterium]
MLKDTIFWMFGAALVLFFNVQKVKSFAHLKKEIVDLLKWSVFSEFILNLYTFSLPVELVLLPVGALLLGLKAYSEAKKEHQALKAVNFMLSGIGTVMLTYVIYKTFTQSQELFKIDNVYSIILPICLTIVFIPVVYFISLKMSYETLFIKIDFIGNDVKRQREIKVAVIRVAGVNLNRLEHISNKLKYNVVYSNCNAISAVRSIIKRF